MPAIYIHTYIHTHTQREHNPDKVPMPAEMPDRGCVYEETRECAHDYHVACAAAAGPSPAFPEGVVLTGTYDYT